MVSTAHRPRTLQDNRRLRLDPQPCELASPCQPFLDVVILGDTHVRKTVVRKSTRTLKVDYSSTATPKRNCGAADDHASAAGLPHNHCSRGLSTEIAAHRDGLRIDWPGELTAESSTAIVRKRSDQLITGSDKYLQGRCCIRARRLNTQFAIAGLVFGSRDRDRVSAGSAGRVG